MTETTERDKMHRIRLLIFSRLIITTFLLGVAAFIQFTGMGFIPDLSLYAVYTIIAAIYLISLVYVGVYRKVSKEIIHVYIQCVFDVVFITALVYSTGGIESVYTILYPLVILYSAFFIGRKGSLFVASLSSVSYGLLLDLEYFEIIFPIRSDISFYDFSAGYVFARIFTHIVSFFLLAVLAGLLVEREKRTRELLTRKTEAFDNLDLLHNSIIESVDSGIMTIDINGHIKSFNRAARDITGYSFQELQDRNIQTLVPHIDGITGRVEGKSIRGLTLRRFEVEIEKKDGTPVLLGCSLSPLEDGAGRIIGSIVIFQDLTSVKKMEGEVEQKKKLAWIGEMAAVLAHEIRSPLTAIGGSLQLLRMDLTVTGTQQRLMDIMTRGRTQLEELTSDFLLLARDNPEPAKTIPVQEIVNDIMDTIRFDGGWHEGITVKQNIEEHAVIYGKEKEIRQVFWNIVENAMQAMTSGGIVTIETKRSFCQDTGVPGIDITISDTGCGIDKKVVEHVTDPFFTTKDSGTGLGLTIVQRIVERHGGALSIRSSVNEGTRVTVSLPSEEGERSCHENTRRR